MSEDRPLSTFVEFPNEACVRPDRIVGFFKQSEDLTGILVDGFAPIIVSVPFDQVHAMLRPQ